MQSVSRGVVTALLLSGLLGGCGGGGNGLTKATSASAQTARTSSARPLATMKTDAGVEVRTPLGVRSSASLAHEFQEIDVTVAAFERTGVNAPLRFVVIDPARGWAPALYQGDDVVLTGIADPPFLPGFPEALGALAEEAGAPHATVMEAVQTAKEGVMALYVNHETLID